MGAMATAAIFIALYYKKENRGDINDVTKEDKKWVVRKTTLMIKAWQRQDFKGNRSNNL